MNNDIIFLLNDAISDIDSKMILNNSNDNLYDNNKIQDNKEQIIIIFNNYEYSKNKIKLYLQKKKKKLYNDLDNFSDFIITEKYNNYKNMYLEYLNDIHNFYNNFIKDIDNISFEDNFDYKFNYEIKNNIKYKYRQIKLRL